MNGPGEYALDVMDRREIISSPFGDITLVPTRDINTKINARAQQASDNIAVLEPHAVDIEPANPELTFTRRRVIMQRRELRNLNRAILNRNFEIDLSELEYKWAQERAKGQFLKGIIAGSVLFFLLILGTGVILG
jgi:hypothetical protein